jgi:hypothetical protein
MGNKMTLGNAPGDTANPFRRIFKKRAVRTGKRHSWSMSAGPWVQERRGGVVG